MKEVCSLLAPFGLVFSAWFSLNACHLVCALTSQACCVQDLTQVVRNLRHAEFDSERHVWHFCSLLTFLRFSISLTLLLFFCKAVSLWLSPGDEPDHISEDKLSMLGFQNVKDPLAELDTPSGNLLLDALLAYSEDEVIPLISNLFACLIQMYTRVSAKLSTTMQYARKRRLFRSCAWLQASSTLFSTSLVHTTVRCIVSCILCVPQCTSSPW